MTAPPAREVTASATRIIAWYWSIRSTRLGARSARRVSIIMIVLGPTVSVINLSAGGASYDQIVPQTCGVLGLIPLIVGAVA